MENENCTRHIFSAWSSRLSKVFVGVLLYSRRNFPTDFIVLPFLSPRIFLIASRAEFAKTALLNTTAFTLFLFLSPGFCSHSLASLPRQKVPTLSEFENAAEYNSAMKISITCQSYAFPKLRSSYCSNTNCP